MVGPRNLGTDFMNNLAINIIYLLSRVIYPDFGLPKLCMYLIKWSQQRLTNDKMQMERTNTWNLEIKLVVTQLKARLTLVKVQDYCIH